MELMERKIINAAMEAAAQAKSYRINPSGSIISVPKGQELSGVKYLLLQPWFGELADGPNPWANKQKFLNEYKAGRFTPEMVMAQVERSVSFWFAEWYFIALTATSLVQAGLALNTAVRQWQYLNPSKLPVAAFSA